MRHPMTLRAPAFLSWERPPSPVTGFDGLVAWHDGRCAYCGQGGHKLKRDHCHETGMLRGLLCHSCNIREGCLPTVHPGWSLWRAGTHPCGVLGLEIPFAAPRRLRNRYRGEPRCIFVVVVEGQAVSAWDNEDAASDEAEHVGGDCIRLPVNIPPTATATAF